MKKLIWLLLLFATQGNAVVDTVYLVNETWDAYSCGTAEDMANSSCYAGYRVAYCAAGALDTYLAFPITSTQYSNTINSIKLSSYLTYDNWEGGEQLRIYGLQQMDCGIIENQNLSDSTRTTNSLAYTVGNAVGQFTTPDFKVVFNEWITDYTHSGTDYFGLVIDDNGNATDPDEEGSRDYSHASYSSNTYLIIDYTPSTTGSQVIIIQSQ